MKSFIFCTCYINNNNIDYNKKRYERWIHYYHEKMEHFGAQNLFLIDDGSKDVTQIKDISIIDAVLLPECLDNSITLVRFADNLGRPFQRDYRGWWRSFSYSVVLAEKYGFDRIIHIESDFFITSWRMMEYIRMLYAGWTTFYSNYFSFPESAIQIICNDSFLQLKMLHRDLISKSFSINKSAELILPFTHVEKKFLGDRFGEVQVLDQYSAHELGKARIDWIGQILPHFHTDDFDLFFEFENSWK